MWSQFAVVLLLCIYFDRAVSVDQQGGWIVLVQPSVLSTNSSYRTCVRVGGRFENFGGKTAGGLPVDGGDVRRQVRVRVGPPPMGAVRVH